MPEYILKGHDEPDFQNLDAFTQGYITALFFTSSDCMPGASGSESLGFLDLSHEALEACLGDCKAFMEANARNLDAAYKIGTYCPERAGIDFWLSRNGHGSGFNNGDLGAIGDRLQRACKWRTKFPEVDAYLGDDGRIYLSEG